MRDPDELLEPADVSAILKIPVATLYSWRHFGRGPDAYRIGRYLRYRRADLDRWLEQQRTARPR